MRMAAAQQDAQPTGCDPQIWGVAGQ